VIIAYALWCGFCWVLRGGKYGDVHRYLFGREPGTTVTRLVCAFLMAAPLAVAFDPVLIVLWLSIYVAMTIGYFDEAMGLEEPGRDHLFLALWGAAVALIATAPLYISPALFSEPPTLMLAIVPPWWAAFGVLATAAYAINKPLDRRFGTDWTERAEFLTGCAVGAALFLGAT
jgi:hypothetical protein